MRKLIVCCFLVSVSASVLAQSSPRMVTEVHISAPKPGMSARGARTSNVHRLATSSGIATSLAPT